MAKKIVYSGIGLFTIRSILRFYIRLLAVHLFVCQDDNYLTLLTILLSFTFIIVPRNWPYSRHARHCIAFTIVSTIVDGSFAIRLIHLLGIAVLLHENGNIFGCVCLLVAHLEVCRDDLLNLPGEPVIVKVQ